MVTTILCPGSITVNSCHAELNPDESPRCDALLLNGLTNTFVFDFLARQQVSANVLLFILARLPVANLSPLQHFLSHSALRLGSNHRGYEPLWREQVGDAWREREPHFSFPVLKRENDRWQQRAAMDATAADAYEINRNQYEHILSSFSHSSYPDAPNLCLARFDELKIIGLEAFTKKYDPYWDIPLNKNLPQPVIELAAPSGDTDPKKQTTMKLEEDVEA